MRLIRGLSRPFVVISSCVAFASHMFRLDVAWARFCFTLGLRPEISLRVRKGQEPARKGHVDSLRRAVPTKAAAPTIEFPTRIKQWKAKAMGFFSKDIKTLDDLFIHILRD